MAEVSWTRPALGDLEAIYAYIAQFNPDAASRIANSLRTAGDNLAAFPDRGRPREDGRRELTAVYPYVLIYRRTNDVVTILRIRHGARAPE